MSSRSSLRILINILFILNVNNFCFIFLLQASVRVARVLATLILPDRRSQGCPARLSALETLPPPHPHLHASPSPFLTSHLFPFHAFSLSLVFLLFVFYLIFLNFSHPQNLKTLMHDESIVIFSLFSLVYDTFLKNRLQRQNPCFRIRPHLPYTADLDFGPLQKSD